MYVPFASQERKKLIRYISKQSGRTLIDIVLYMVYKTFQEADVREIIRHPLAKTNRGSRRRTRSVWISQALFRKLTDIAFKLGVHNAHPQSPTKVSAARLIGLCVNYQLSAQNRKQWITFFTSGDDILDRAFYEFQRLIQSSFNSTRVN